MPSPRSVVLLGLLLLLQGVCGRLGGERIAGTNVTAHRRLTEPDFSSLSTCLTVSGIKFCFGDSHYIGETPDCCSTNRGCYGRTVTFVDSNHWSFSGGDGSTWEGCSPRSGDVYLSCGSANTLTMTESYHGICTYRFDLQSPLFCNPSSLPVSYYPVSTYPNGLTLTQNNPVAVVVLPTFYTLSFDIYFADCGTTCALATNQHVVRLSGNGNGFTGGGTIPTVVVQNSDGQGYKIYTAFVGSGTCSDVCSGNQYCPAICTVNEMDIFATGTFQLNTWSTVVITVDTINRLMTMTVSGGLTFSGSLTFPTPMQTTWPSAQLFAGGDFLSMTTSKIRNLAIFPPAPTAVPTPRPSPRPSPQPTAPSVPPTPRPSARPTRAPRDAPVAQPTLTPTLGAKYQHYWYKTWHRGADCASTPDVIDLFLGSLGKCAAGVGVGGTPHMDACRVGENKYSITRTSYADPFCLGAPSALVPVQVLEHDLVCAKDKKGGVSGNRDGFDYVKTHCAVPIEALLLPNPNALYVATTSFIGAGCTGASFTRLRILGVCKPWAEPGAPQGEPLGHRKITVADTLGALRLVAQHYSHTDTLCQHPLRAETVVLSQPGGAAGECHPDPLNPGMSYSAAQLGPVNLFTLTDTAPQPPTLSPTRAPTMPTAPPTAAPTTPTAAPTAAPPPALTNWVARLSAAGTGASQTVITAHYNFLIALSNAGLMSKIVRLNTFAGNDVTAALIPLIKGGGSSSEIVYSSTGALSSGWDGTYTQTGGLSPSPSAGKLLWTGQRISHVDLTDDSSAPSNAANLHFGMQFLDNPTINCRVMGVFRNYMYTQHYLLSESNTDFGWGTPMSSTQSITAGLNLLSGTGSGSVTRFMCAKGSSTCTSSSHTGGDGTQPSDWPVGIFGCFGSWTGSISEDQTVYGLCGSGSNTRSSGYTIGYSLSSTEVAALSSAWKTLLADLGRS